MDHFLSGVERKRFKEQTSAFVLRKSTEREVPKEEQQSATNPNVK